MSCMKFLVSRNTTDPGDVDNLKKFFGFNICRIGGFSVLTNEADLFRTKGSLTAVIDGYIRNFNYKVRDLALQQESSIEFIKEKWPVSNSITGSFSCTIIDEAREE